MSREPSVLFLCLDMDPFGMQGDQHTGAAHLYVRETLEVLAEHHIPTLAVTRWDSPEKPQAQSVGSVKLVRVQVGEIDVQPKEFLWGQQLEIATRTMQILSQESFSPTTIHAVYWYSGSLALLLRQSYPDAKLVYTIVSLGKVKHAWQGHKSLHDEAREACEQAIFDVASLVVSVAAKEKEDAVGLYDLQPEKVVVVGRGIDPELFTSALGRPHTASADEGSLYDPSSPQRALLFVGRLIPSKGYVWLLQIYNRLLSDDTIDVPPLWIVGGTRDEVREAWRRGLLTDTLLAANRQGRIWWWGAVRRETMPLFYQRALVTCIPSRYEPGARVILESMACGTPVIMTPTGYADELVRTGFNGFVADFEDSTSWILYLKGLIRCRAWRDTLACRAQASVLPHYSLRSFGERHWAVYQYVLGASCSPLVKTVDLSTAAKICPRWETPPGYPSHEPPSPTDLEAVLRRNLPTLDPIKELRITPRSLSDGSTASYGGLVGTADDLHIKCYKDKSLFYDLFWPVAEGAAFRSAKARWLAEQVLESDPLFLRARIRDESTLSLAYEPATPIASQQWNTDLILHCLVQVEGFHNRMRDRFANALSRLQILPIPSGHGWAGYLAKYRHIQAWNAHFRNGQLWHSPACLLLECEVLKLGLLDDIWALPKLLSAQMLTAVTTFSDSFDGPWPSIVIWGECRPAHFLCCADGRIRAVDAETVQSGEEELDFATFFWWLLDFRTQIPAQSAYEVLGDILQKWNRPMQSKYRVLAWIWMQCVYWYLWDRTKGNEARSANYLEFITDFDRICTQKLAQQRREGGRAC